MVTSMFLFPYYKLDNFDSQPVQGWASGATLTVKPQAPLVALTSPPINSSIANSPDISALRQKLRAQLVGSSAKLQPQFHGYVDVLYFQIEKFCNFDPIFFSRRGSGVNSTVKP